SRFGSDPERTSFTYSGLLRILRRENPEMIITNAFNIATTKLWLRSFIHRTPYIISSGAIRSPGRIEHQLRRLQRRLLIQRAQGFIAYGSRARDYLVELGAHAGDVSIAINTVDTCFYAKAARKSVNQFNGDERPKSLLYLGRLAAGKKVDQLLRVIK